MRYNPTLPDVAPGLALAATYRREVRAEIDRIWENVLDWEHLPALHESYFNHVALVDSGSWGWRVELTKTPRTPDRRMLVELRVDREKARYRADPRGRRKGNRDLNPTRSARGPSDGD
jgi:hypothetical protein